MKQKLPSEEIQTELSWEEAVARYLEDHPDYFQRYPETLSRILLSHETGGKAVSLIERQVQVLREQSQTLQRQLRELVNNARENDVLSGRLHRFATYTGARIEEIRVAKGRVFCRLGDRRHELEFEAVRSGRPGLLRAPSAGSMTPLVRESLTGRVRVRFKERTSGRILFEGTGRHAGFETGGETGWLADSR